MDIKKILVASLPLHLGVNFRAITQNLGKSLERLKLFFEGIIVEADPVTATKTIGLWCENQGLKCDINQSISKLQRVASQAFFGLGAQNKTYLESQIQKVFPEIFLNYYSFDTAFQAGAGMCGKMVASDYPSWAPHNVTFASCFLVSGTTDFVSDLKVLKQIIGKICPAHLEPIYQVEIKNLQATAQSGFGMCGIMLAGKS